MYSRLTILFSGEGMRVFGMWTQRPQVGRERQYDNASEH